jgi:glycosyltransferase involved in cell wall biosynthesis
VKDGMVNFVLRYSIITPTLGRESLIKTCESVTNQTNPDWEHIVMIDVPLIVNKQAAAIVESIPKDPRRKFIRCGKQHKDYGNTCRWNAWERASGIFCIYIDDDDMYADNEVLETLNQVTAPWATFPTMRWGAFYSVDPPGFNRSGSGMFIHRREIGRYPCKEHCEIHQEFMKKAKKEFPHHDLLYAADGLLAQYLYENYPYQRLECRPLTIYQKSNKGE